MIQSWNNCSVYYLMDVDIMGIIHIYPNCSKFEKLQIGQVMDSYPKVIYADVMIEGENRIHIIGKEPLSTFISTYLDRVPISSLPEEAVIPEEWIETTFFRKRRLIKKDMSFRIFKGIKPYDKQFIGHRIVIHHK